MSEADHYRRRAETLLKQASETANMKERGQLIDEAMRWHMAAVDANGHASDRLNDNRDSDEGEARA